MNLYVGSRNYSPEGFLTLDIDDTYHPDIVADITDMKAAVKDESVSCLIAGAVLEHIAWPKSFKAMCEFARVLKKEGVLKISVPDMKVLSSLIAAGKSSWYAMGIIYGSTPDNEFENHRFGFTEDMLLELLTLLGFGRFRFWNSEIADSSNGWYPLEGEEKIFGQINIECVKLYEPAVKDLNSLYERMRKTPLKNLNMYIADICRETNVEMDLSHAHIQMAQTVTFQLIEAKQRIKYLEEVEKKQKDEIEKYKRKSERNNGARESFFRKKQ